VGINEPTVRESVEAGFSLVLFSGDKMLGDRRPGIIAGKRSCAKSAPAPLFRALRVDKLTIAAMEAICVRISWCWKEIPRIRMMQMSFEEFSARTDAFLQNVVGKILTPTRKSKSAMGCSACGRGFNACASRCRRDPPNCERATFRERIRGSAAIGPGKRQYCPDEDDRLLLICDGFPGAGACSREALASTELKCCIKKCTRGEPIDNHFPKKIRNLK